jgi:hypothetical protein
MYAIASSDELFWQYYGNDEYSLAFQKELYLLKIAIGTGKVGKVVGGVGFAFMAAMAAPVIIGVVGRAANIAAPVLGRLGQQGLTAAKGLGSSLKETVPKMLKELPKELITTEVIDKVGEAIGVPLGLIFDLRDAKQFVHDLYKFAVKTPSLKLVTPDGKDLDLDSPMLFSKETDPIKGGNLSGGKKIEPQTKSYDEKLSDILDTDGRKLLDGKDNIYRATDEEFKEAKAKIDLHRANKKKEAEINANGGKINLNSYAGGNYGYLEGQINNKAIDNKLWRSGSIIKETDEMIAQREAKELFDHIKAINKDGKTTYRNLDAEYKMLNQLAHDLGAKKGGKYPEMTGILKIVSENPYCPSCYGVINQFNEMLPNIKLIWFITYFWNLIKKQQPQGGLTIDSRWL